VAAVGGPQIRPVRPAKINMSWYWAGIGIGFAGAAVLLLLLLWVNHLDR
jgi:hypothetical protein